MKIIIPWLVALAALGGVFYFHKTAADSAQAVAGLQQQVNELQGVRAENEQLKTNQVPGDELDRLRADSHEVLKLRNEVQMLHGEQAKLQQSVTAAQNQSQQAQAQAEQAQAQAEKAQAAQAQLLSAARQAAPMATAPAAATPLELLNHCINNLRQIDAAKNQWALENGKTSGAVPKEADITPYLKNGVLPACPAGGTYTINALDIPPTCSIEGHVLP